MTEEKLLKTYLNGNYEVRFFSLGGRVIKPLCQNPGRMEFPNAMDVCITKNCDNKCPFCYNDSTVLGKHCDLSKFKEIIKSYKGGEIAIGGGNAFTHPDIEEMLRFCKSNEIFVSMTINQNHLKKHKDQVLSYFQKDLIKSVGISMTDPRNWDEGVYQEINQAKEEGVTIHVIAGILDNTYFKSLTGKKILILGYKDLGRGKNKVPSMNIEWLKEEWLEILRYKCPVIIFDNLAIEQLNIKEKFSPEEWGMIYQGDDGDGTMYIDLVDDWFGKSSIVDEKDRHRINSTEIKNLYDELK